MAILRIGYYWHLRYLESHIAVMLGRNELSSPETVRESKNIKGAIKHSTSLLSPEDAINEPNLLDQEEKAIMQEFLTELESTYTECTTKAYNGYLSDLLCSTDEFQDHLIVIEARIRGTFFPAIQKMSISKLIESRHEHIEIDLDRAFKGKSKVINLFIDLADSQNNKVKHNPKRHGSDAIKTLKKFLKTLKKPQYIQYFHTKGEWITSDVYITIAKN